MFTQYVWNIVQMMFNCMCFEEMTTPPIFPFPWDKAPPATLMHAECHYCVSKTVSGQNRDCHYRTLYSLGAIFEFWPGRM